MYEIINYIFGQDIKSAKHDILGRCRIGAIALSVLDERWVPNEEIINMYNAVEIKISELSKIKCILKEKEAIVASKKPKINGEQVNNIIDNYNNYYNASKKYLIDNDLNDLLFFSDIMSKKTLNKALNRAVTNLYYNYDQENAIRRLIRLDECFDLSSVKQNIRGNFLLKYKEEYSRIIEYKFIKSDDKGNNEETIEVD